MGDDLSLTKYGKQVVKKKTELNPNSEVDMTNKVSQKVCVFSLGQYGYDIAFQNAVDSQKAYCEKYNYDYVCINEDGSELLGRENIWLKAIALLAAVLENDYVLYLDTDVEIKAECPPFEGILDDENPIGLVAGHSGRVNAGVIYAKRTTFSINFFAEWAASLGKPISPRHDVGWGENGHLIRLAEKYCLSLVDTKWNNTFNEDLDDYVRHYTGPLRKLYRFTGDSEVAWNRIKEAVNTSKVSDDVDIIRSFDELRKVHLKSLNENMFAEFQSAWSQIRKFLYSPNMTDLSLENDKSFHRVYIVENIAEDSQNAYVLSLKNGLSKVLGKERVFSGVDYFWEHEFCSKDIVHIEWVESLFNWNIPTDVEINNFKVRLRDIGQKCPIVYTAHNFDLMPTYGDEKRELIMNLLNEYCTLFCHLSEANVQPYINHHSPTTDLSVKPTSIVPHGDYQPYFNKEIVQFEDEALRSEKIKILVFGHIRTEKELNFCLKVAEELGSDRYQMIFAGVIHPDLLHWKEIHKLKDSWDEADGPRRIHFKVEDDKIIDLVDKVDCLLIPRFERLNSGVQFLAHTLLKPSFVPYQYSMREIQSKVTGHGCYPTGEHVAAAKVIDDYFEESKSIRIKNLYKSFVFNYKEQDCFAVGQAHKVAYEKAMSFFSQR
jgi:hypothetical protein